jgi:F-type H+-transporting ATPase subunit gamma
MANLKEVRKRIKSIISTQQITKAMKMVSASKLRKAQDNILQMRPFADKLNQILNNVVKATEDSVKSDYAEIRDPDKILIVVITSDRGLCGAFNSNVFKRVISTIHQDFQRQYDHEDLFILPIGKKSYDFFRKRPYQVIDDYWQVLSHLTYNDVKEISEFIMKEFKREQYDRVFIAYNEFKNVATQILRVDQFLPVEPMEHPAEDMGINDYIFEPTQEYIVKELIPQSLRVQFYKSILESVAAEHGARMTAMDQATENAEDLLGELRITYNRTRQAVITKELNEIVGGAQALAEG